MPLGHHLGADQDVDIARLELFQHRQQAVLAAGGVPVQAGHPGGRKKALQKFFEFLGPQAVVPDFVGPAVRAGGPGRAGVAAVVAAVGIGPLMIGQADAAVPAFQGGAAGRADGVAGVAAPVQKNQGLLAPLEGFADGRDELGGEVFAHPAFVLDRAQVQDGNLGQGLGLNPTAQADAQELALLVVEIALHRRGGRAHDDRAGVHPGAHGGQIARIVAQAGFLFVGAVMLLIHDDEADSLEGGENG